MGLTMAVKDRISLDVEAAVHTDDPVGQLRDAVSAELYDRGTGRDELLATLDAHRLDYKAEGRERDEEAVTRIMERLVGWCAPAARI
jgi:hypothetical protein